jgi:hypothetical protein
LPLQQAPDVLTKDEQETVVRLLDTEARSGGDPFKMLIMGPLDPIPEVEAAYAREGYVMEYLDLDAPVIPGCSLGCFLCTFICLLYPRL